MDRLHDPIIAGKPPTLFLIREPRQSSMETALRGAEAPSKHRTSTKTRHGRVAAIFLQLPQIPSLKIFYPIFEAAIGF